MQWINIPISFLRIVTVIMIICSAVIFFFSGRGNFPESENPRLICFQLISYYDLNISNFESLVYLNDL